jgi:Domain of Unknown Function (DUF1080)
MTRMTVVTMGLLVVGLTVLGGAYLSFGQSDAGWTTLIDGAKGLENWDRVGDANWRVEDGAIVADKGKGGFLVSKSSYKDFQIRAEFWADHTTNSGVFIRCTDPKAITATNAYEVNIYDQRPEPIYGTGAIVNIAKVEPMPKAGGKWNTYEIRAKGAQLTVVLNGVKTADVQDSKHAQGPFALQFGNRANEAPGGAIKWRKVQIKSL